MAFGSLAGSGRCLGLPGFGFWLATILGPAIAAAWALRLRTGQAVPTFVSHDEGGRCGNPSPAMIRSRLTPTT